MTYAWTLFDSNDQLMAIFTSAELAFRSLERSHGTGLVKVVHRGPKLWKIHIKGNGVLLCTKWVLLSGPTFFQGLGPRV